MFVRDVQIDVNWLLNQVLGSGKTNYQITKIDNEQIMVFLTFLRDNPFKMPNGMDAIYWVRERISFRYEQSQNKMSQEWERVRQKYRYILHQISILLLKYEGLKSEENIENSNDLSVSFE